MSRFNIFSYPPNDIVIQETIKDITMFLRFTEMNYRIIIPVEVINAREIFPKSLCDTLDDFFFKCRNEMGGIKTEWLFYLLCFIKNPCGMEAFRCDNFLKDYLSQIADKVTGWSPFIGLHFFALRGAKFIGEPTLWGQSQGDWPNVSISLETSGYKESIWHEMSHQFSVSEGYYEDTKHTKKGCETCWMQYDSTLGNGLCSKHQKELRDKIVSVKQ